MLHEGSWDPCGGTWTQWTFPIKWPGQQWAGPRAGDRCLPSPRHGKPSHPSQPQSGTGWLHCILEEARPQVIPNKYNISHLQMKFSTNTLCQQVKPLVPFLGTSLSLSWHFYPLPLCMCPQSRDLGTFSYMTAFSSSLSVHENRKCGGKGDRVKNCRSYFSIDPKHTKVLVLQGAVWRSLPWTTEITS